MTTIQLQHTMHRRRNQGDARCWRTSWYFQAGLHNENRHSVEHVIKIKMASQKRISDYFQRVSQSLHLKGRLIQLILLIQVMGLMRKKTLQRL